MKYFRTVAKEYAKELGHDPKEIDNLGDFDVWNYIRAAENKPPLTLPIVIA
jgi:hypothetical protein